MNVLLIKTFISRNIISSRSEDKDVRIYRKLSNYIFRVKIIVSPHCHSSLTVVVTSQTRYPMSILVCRARASPCIVLQMRTRRQGKAWKSAFHEGTKQRFDAWPPERGRKKNRNPSKEDLCPVKLDVRRLNSSRSSVYRRIQHPRDRRPFSVNRERTRPGPV